MKSNLALGLTVLALAASAQAQENRHLSDASHLRKLSYHLRGAPPSSEEFAELAAAVGAGSTSEFFTRKIGEYQAAPGYATKINFRLEELFRLKTEHTLADDTDFYVVPFNRRNALNDLFRGLARENEPWDKLLKGKSYALYPKTEFDYSLQSDFAFMRALSPELPGVGQDEAPRMGPFPTIEVSYAADDARVAGALSTSRFFARYTTTALNKNRRRAAAVFNIFLCDAMSAAVPPPADEADDVLDRAFPDTSQISQDEERIIRERGDRHGSDAACAQCHYKLDPMGQAFASSAFSLSEWPSAGRLTFKDKRTNEFVDVPGRGLGEVAQAISMQPAYVDCQVGRFWNWYIGEDRPLPEAKRAELASAFERVGRRTNDFVKVLVNQPEFRNLDLRSPAEVRADEVKRILKNCSDCHADSLPNFTEWPIGGSADSMRGWLGRIGRSLDLENDGKARTMPPSYSPWHPSDAELKFLKDWMKDGAPAESGQPQIPTFRARSFVGKQIRYMMPHELLDLLALKLPAPTREIAPECKQLTDANRGLLGDSLPSTGSPIFDQPTSSFVRWYSNCMNARLRSLASLRTEPDALVLFGPTLGNRVLADRSLGSRRFAELPVAERRRMVIEQIAHMIGPEDVIKDFGFFAGTEALADHVSRLIDRKPELTVSDAGAKALFYLSLRDEFLSY